MKVLTALVFAVCAIASVRSDACIALSQPVLINALVPPHQRAVDVTAGPKNLIILIEAMSAQSIVSISAYLYNNAIPDTPVELPLTSTCCGVSCRIVSCDVGCSDLSISCCITAAWMQVPDVDGTYEVSGVVSSLDPNVCGCCLQRALFWSSAGGAHTLSVVCRVDTPFIVL